MSVENWKDPSIPKKQLLLNLQELVSPDTYPDHWKCILKMIPNNQRILDIGCGVGSIARLLEKEGFNNSYVGIDFSESTIECANQHWKKYTFTVGDVMKLSDVRDTDVLICNGLLDVMPNAVEALHKILSYKAHYVILSRINLENHEQHGYYDAYGIAVPKYTFCSDIFYKSVNVGGYDIVNKLNNTFLLKCKNDLDNN